MNARLQVMLDSREIEALPADDAEVLGMWAKATKTLQSASLPGLEADPDAQFTLLYQSALQGATAVVRAAGYRVKGDSNHYNTYAAARALDVAELSDAARELNIIRQRRHAAVYDWDEQVGADEVRALRDATVRLLAAADGWLRGRRASLAGRLAPLVVPSG